MIARDEFGQPDGEWSACDLTVLAILEEVASPDHNPHKPLAAYLSDIKDLYATETDDLREFKAKTISALSTWAELDERQSKLIHDIRERLQQSDWIVCAEALRILDGTS